jgi:hypothetical protein
MQIMNDRFTKTQNGNSAWYLVNKSIKENISSFQFLILVETGSGNKLDERQQYILLKIIFAKQVTRKTLASGTEKVHSTYTNKKMNPHWPLYITSNDRHHCIRNSKMNANGKMIGNRIIAPLDPKSWKGILGKLISF